MDGIIFYGSLFCGAIIVIVWRVVEKIKDHIQWKKSINATKEPYKDPFEGITAEEIIGTWEDEKERFQNFTNAFTD